MTIQIHELMSSHCKFLIKPPRDHKKDKAKAKNMFTAVELEQLREVVVHLRLIIQTYNLILTEYIEPDVLSLTYFQQFHTTIKNRVEIIFTNFQAVEGF